MLDVDFLPGPKQGLRHPEAAVGRPGTLDPRFGLDDVRALRRSYRPDSLNEGRHESAAPVYTREVLRPRRTLEEGFVAGRMLVLPSVAVRCIAKFVEVTLLKVRRLERLAQEAALERAEESARKERHLDEELAAKSAKQAAELDVYDAKRKASRAELQAQDAARRGKA